MYNIGESLFNSLLAEVAAAFPAKQIDPAIFADPTDVWRGGYDDAPELESTINGKTWTMLDSRFVELHHRALRYMTPLAFVAVLPACLVAFIKNDDELDHLPGYLLTQLTRRPKFQTDFDARSGLMTERQRLVVARVLATIQQSRVHSPRAQDIQTSLDSYWGALLGGKDEESRD